MTVAVVGIALALPAGLQLLVSNGRALAGQWDTAIELSVYLEGGVTADEARRMAANLEADDTIASVRLITAEQAWQSLETAGGLGQALAALDENPLPHTLVIVPAAGRDTPEAVSELAARLRDSLPAELVQADTEWVARLHAMLDVLRRVVLLAGLMLALGVGLIVGNTIRLDIQARRDEIEVAKLIGATDAFIRRPFLYSGLWHGLLGGLLALALVSLSLWALEGPVARLAGLYGTGFRLVGPGPAGALALTAAGALLGWGGSWLSANRNLRRIEPRA